jgi:hypothetical protein
MLLEDYASQSRALLEACPDAVKVLLKRIDATRLYPPFLEKLIAALSDLVDRSHFVYVTAGVRTWEEQHALFMKGRRGVEGEGKVTLVDAGGSAHNYGIAADGAYDSDDNKAGLQPSWDRHDMKVWADAGVAAGLDAGFYWKNFYDGPHLQLDIRSQGISPKDQLMKAYKTNGGMVGVFTYLDGFSW